MVSEGIMREKDLYKALEISADAGEKEIRAAHRSLAKKYHPDRGAGSSAEKFRDIQTAYKVLGDPDQRADYDRRRRLEAAQSTTIGIRVAPRRATVSSMRPSAHIDLRNLGSQTQGERLQFGGGLAASRGASSSDPWAELIAFLFDDFPL